MRKKKKKQKNKKKNTDTKTMDMKKINKKLIRIIKSKERNLTIIKEMTMMEGTLEQINSAKRKMNLKRRAMMKMALLKELMLNLLEVVEKQAVAKEEEVRRTNLSILKKTSPPCNEIWYER